MTIQTWHIVAFLLVVTIAYRWYITRNLLYRMTDKADRLLQVQGAPSVNFFSSPQMRKLLTLHTLARRLDNRLDALLDSASDPEDASHSVKER